MLNCERGVGQGWWLPVDGGEIKSDRHPIVAGWSPGGTGGAIANGSSGGEGDSGGGGSGGRGMRPCVALSARALFQELGIAMAVSVA